MAGRQIYLQNLPSDQVPTCAPPMDFLMDTLPIFEAVQTVLLGDGNCAEVLWSFMGVSIPGWTLIGFIITLIYTAKVLLSADEIHSHKQN